jgi:N utilization substance protein B
MSRIGSSARVELKVRREARMRALQALFEIDSVGHSVETVLAHRVEDEPMAPEGAAFTRALTHGVTAHRLELDKLIEKYAPEWPVDQLAIVDRNVLRLAFYELLFVEDVPTKVAINEAVELAKMFGSDSAPRFINGVLGAFVAQNPAPKSGSG